MLQLKNASLKSDRRYFLVVLVAIVISMQQTALFFRFLNYSQTLLFAPGSLDHRHVELPLCTMKQVSQGKWNPVTLDRPPYIPRQSKCYTPEELHNSTSFKYHYWIPNDRSKTCDYDVQFNKERFCRLAQNKTVGLMGDSLTWEHFASLVGHFGRQVGSHSQLYSTSDDGVKYSQQSGFLLNVCNDSVKVAFKRQRYLSNVPDFLTLADPDILVLNRGAHHVDDNAFLQGTTELVHLMEEHQLKCRSQGRECLVLWRSTAPGHPRCQTYTEPATSREEMELALAYDPENDPEKYPGPKKYYYWWDFDRINNLIIDRFQNATQLSFDYLPAFEANILRPDAHVSENDCLHNCDPGSSVDTYNTFLLHAMRRTYERYGVGDDDDDSTGLVNKG